jgi:hypothetical protein
LNLNGNAKASLPRQPSTSLRSTMTKNSNMNSTSYLNTMGRLSSFREKETPFKSKGV